MKRYWILFFHGNNKSSFKMGAGLSMWLTFDFLGNEVVGGRIIHLPIYYYFAFLIILFPVVDYFFSRILKRVFFY